MKVLLVLCLAFASAHCQIWNSAIRVKWGAPFVAEDYFIEIDRGETATIRRGWVKTARPDTPLPSLVMYCPEGDYTFCSMFDDTGFIAGLQIAINKETFTDTPIELNTITFTEWSAPDGNTYMTVQQYFVSEETLSKTHAERMAMRAYSEETLLEGAVWVPDLDGTLLKIVDNETDIAAGIWKQQSCIISMGMHYYYNMSSSIDCSKLFPWFAMTNDARLIATGFMVYGNFTAVAPGQRMWFEQPGRSVVEIILPDAPECVYELADSPGRITMHIFYGKHPWTIGC